jgi:hypothetical protein
MTTSMDFDSEFSNMWFDYIAKNLDKNWDWDELSQNSNLTPEILKKSLEIDFNFPWDWQLISSNKIFTWEFIQENLASENPYPWDWDWDGVSQNPNITWEIISNDLKTENPKPWYWYSISTRDFITWEIIESNLDKDWDWSCISYKKFITWENIESNLDKDWDWQYISEKIATPDIVQRTLDSNLEIPWDWECISHNDNMTWDFFKKNFDKDLCLYNLSVHPCITWDVIRQNLESIDPDEPEITWWNYIHRNDNLIQNVPMDLIIKYSDLIDDECWGYLSFSKSITMSDITNNLDLPWDWEEVSNNPNITIDFIKNDLQSPNPKDWNWENLSKNDSISLSDIENNTDLPWDWESISRWKKDITIDFIKNDLQSPNPKDWNWENLSMNYFSISLNDIENNPDLPWDWSSVFQRENITIEFVMKFENRIPNNIHLYTSDEAISSYSYPEIFLKSTNNPNRFINEISENPNITWDIVKNNPELPWNWHYLSSNSMSGWRSNFVEQRRQQERCKDFQRELFAVCAQPAWLFSHCMSVGERAEVDMCSEESLNLAREAMPLNFRVQSNPLRPCSKAASGECETCRDRFFK